VKQLKTASFGLEEERVAWDGLAASCAGPIRRLAAFVLVGFVSFVAATTAMVLFYNLFGARYIEGAGVPVPERAFYATMALGAALAIGGYLAWLTRSLRSFRQFGRILRRGDVDPERPTANGLRAYSDEQLLALRSRYEHPLVAGAQGEQLLVAVGPEPPSGWPTGVETPPAQHRGEALPVSPALEDPDEVPGDGERQTR